MPLHGAFKVQLIDGDVGTSASLVITYPQTLPSGMVYWGYGPTPDNTTPHWYPLAASIAGNTVTLTTHGWRHWGR